MFETNFRVYVFYAILYGIFLLIGEGILRLLKVSPAWSRNFAHLAAGLSSLAFPWLFSTHWWVLGITLHSITFLLATRLLGLLGSHHSSAGNSLGSYLFFASMYLCYLAWELSSELSLFLVPVLVLTLADPAASITGRLIGRHPWPGLRMGSNEPEGPKPGRQKRPRLRLACLDPAGLKFNAEGKTLEGSAAFFLVSLLVLSLSLARLSSLSPAVLILVSLGLSALLTVVEAISKRGSDNFFIPLITLIFCILLFL